MRRAARRRRLERHVPGQPRLRRPERAATSSLAQRFLPGTETRRQPRRACSRPPGVVAGQKIKLFFNQLVRADAGERD
ncbi:MAG: hypothetical protein MZW92_65180 [Comamonadaceae bacterium]|nr:hypothetical protein [Comamonadaceae bacterium]